MSLAAVSVLSQQVLALAFVLGAVFGWLGQRTHFCTLGAVSDVLHMGDYSRLRMWALALAVALLGFAGLRAAGLINPAQSLYATQRLLPLSALVGGLMFGFGMVLASGCASKTLNRIGGGNLKSVVVFVVAGVAAFATLKGLTGVLRAATVDQVALPVAAPGDVATLLALALGLPAASLRLGLSATLALLLLAWALRAPDFRQRDKLLGGAGVGLVVVAMWWLSGYLGHVAEHPDTLQEAYLGTRSGRMESVSFVAPMAYTLEWLMLFSDHSNTVSLGVATAVGVVLGATVSALGSHSFRWEGFAHVDDLAQHLMGAVLMGVGGVTALGCSIGQGLSGLSTLSVGSLIATAAIVGGAVLALRYQVWRLA